MLIADRLKDDDYNDNSEVPGRTLHQDRSPYDQAAGGLQLGAENKVLDQYVLTVFSSIFIPCGDNGLSDEIIGFLKEREILLLAHR